MDAWKETLTAIVTVLVAIIGVAWLATLVSKNSNTTGVISAVTGGVSQLIGAATGPVSGNGGLSGLNTFTGAGALHSL